MKSGTVVAAAFAALAALLGWRAQVAAPSEIAAAAAPLALEPATGQSPTIAPAAPARTSGPQPAAAKAASAADPVVVWPLCGMGGVAISAASAARAAGDPFAALPDHLGRAAADAARPTLLAALDAGPPRWRAAALLLRGASPAGVPALTALRALAAASDDPVVAMWASLICLRGEACTGADGQRWLALEPDNLAPWLGLLDRAGAGGEALLPRMAQAQRFDTHAQALLEVVLQAMPSAVTPYLQEAFWIEAIGVQAALPLSGLGQLSALCKTPLQDGDPRRAACGAIAHTLIERSDSMSGTVFGLRLAERSGLSPADAKLRRAELNAGLRQRLELFSGPQPLSCASLEQARARLQQLASQGESGMLRAASAPR